MVQRWKKRPPGSNWGDFGADDQVGMLNLITPELRLRAFAEVREGRAFVLSLPLDYPGGQVLIRTRRPPAFEVVGRGSHRNYNYPMSDADPRYTDVICDEQVHLFTQYSTQWDGLSHAGQHFDADDDGTPEAVYYNGYRAGEDIVGPDHPEGPRSKALGIETMATTGVQGRGVLVDLKREFGLSRHLVGYDDLMRVLKSSDIAVERGDILCLYTGFADLLLGMDKQPDADKLKRSCAVLDGRDQKLLDWITDSGVVAIAADNFAVEQYPYQQTPGDDKYPALPLHAHCLFKLGLHLGELWYFEALNDWLQSRDRHHFLLTAPPLRLPGAAGSPVTPIATV